MDARSVQRIWCHYNLRFIICLVFHYMLLLFSSNEVNINLYPNRTHPTKITPYKAYKFKLCRVFGIYSSSQNPFCYMVILLDFDLFDSSFSNGFNVFYILLWFYVVILLSRMTGVLYSIFSHNKT